MVANAVFQAVTVIGMPECGINLAHGATYLAQAKKNRTAYAAYKEALHDAQAHGNLPIPMMLRNAPTKLMKDLGYNEGYEQYSAKDFMPDKLKDKKYITGE